MIDFGEIIGLSVMFNIFLILFKLLIFIFFNDVIVVKIKLLWVIIDFFVNYFVIYDMIVWLELFNIEFDRVMMLL